MAKLIRQPPNEAALDKLREIYLKAESDIIREIGRLRSRGLVDYHAVAALERVQKILQTMIDDCWTYTPRMVEEQFYVRVPEARKILEPVEKHIAGYQNAQALTATQMAVVDVLVTNLMAEVTEAAQTAQARLQDILIGPLDDRTRSAALEFTAQMAAEGKGVYKALPEFVAALRRDGVIAFTDRAGRDWSLHTYCSMCARATSRQAETLAVITAEESHDLYKISSHGTTCGLCAPFEGRVYSRSGTDPDFPPLSVAFGKVDPNGTDDLTNTYLNIHPQCLHVILPWTPAGRTPEEIQKIKDFSNPAKNPFSVDPRTEKQIAAYRKKQKARADWLRDYRQWERYQLTLGDKAPKTFATFQKHKHAKDRTYKKWMAEYREAKQVEKYSRVRYHEDGTVVVTDKWIAHRSIPRQYHPNAVVETHFSEQVDRIFYDEKGRIAVQMHSGDHAKPKFHRMGVHGEHAHEFRYSEDGKVEERVVRELTERERKENADIL